MLSDKDSAELKAMQDRIVKSIATVSKSRDDLAASRGWRLQTFETLGKAMLQSRKAYELATAIEGKGMALPKVADGSKYMARILNAAAEYRQALEHAPADPSVDRAKKALTGAIDEYARASAAFTARKLAYRELAATTMAEIDETAAKLRGLGVYLSTHVPRAERRELSRRIREVMPRTSKQRRPETAVPVVTKQDTAANNTSAAA